MVLDRFWINKQKKTSESYINERKRSEFFRMKKRRGKLDKQKTFKKLKKQSGSLEQIDNNAKSFDKPKTNRERKSCINKTTEEKLDKYKIREVLNEQKTIDKKINFDRSYLKRYWISFWFILIPLCPTNFVFVI